MKTKVNLATYESPKAELFALDPEGILCDSTVRGISHEGYDNGGDIDI